MRDDHDRDAAGVERAQHLRELELRVAIDACGRLVEDQQLRVGCERARDQDALLLAAGQLTDASARELCHADAFERTNGLPAFFACESAEAALRGTAGEDDLQNRRRQTRRDDRALRDVADALARARVGRRPLEQQRPAARRLQQTERDLQQRGLARAVGAEKNHVIPRVDRERDVGKNASRFVRERHVVELDQV